MITLIRSIATNLVIYFQGIWNKYDHLFQTTTRPGTGQGVGSVIVPRLYLNVYLDVVIWSQLVRTLLRYCNSKSIDFKCALNLIMSWSRKDRHTLSVVPTFWSSLLQSAVLYVVHHHLPLCAIIIDFSLIMCICFVYYV